MGTSAASPEVIVTVNNAVSRCLDDCSFAVQPALTPVLNTATLANNILTLNITTQTGVPPYAVVFAGQQCTYVSGTN